MLPDVGEGPGRARVLAMIIVESLTKKYGGFTAVDHVTFRAEPGRVTGFLGPNGAGKSTTMRILVGLTPASSGTVDRARPPVRRPPEPRTRDRGAARRVGAARGSHRPRDPHPRPAHHAGLPLPRGRDARPGEPQRGGVRPPGPRLLAGHAAAARHRHRPDRRPGGARPRRAGQRSRPGRHPLDARPAPGLRQQGRHRPALVAPAARDRGRRRRPRRHRQRPHRRRRHQERAARGGRHLRQRSRRGRPGRRPSAPPGTPPSRRWAASAPMPTPPRSGAWPWPPAYP